MPGFSFSDHVALLNELLTRHQASGFAGERYFFRSERGDAPPGKAAMTMWTREAYLAAGVAYGRKADALTLHSARHSFATWLLEHGVPVPLVARLMGERVETVLAVYSHHIPNREQVAVDVLNSLAAGGSAKVTFETGGAQ